MCYLVSEPAQGAVLPAALQPEDLQSRWDDHLLLLVIGRGHSLERLEELESVLPSLGLVRSHSPDSPPEDLGGSPEVEGTAAGLHVAALLQEVEILQLVAVEVTCKEKVSGELQKGFDLTRNVDFLTSHDNDLLSVEDEFSNNGSKTSIHVASAVNDDSLGCKARHSSEI